METEVLVVSSKNGTCLRRVTLTPSHRCWN